MTTSATRAASIRANVDAFLAARGIDLGGGRVTMLAHARVLGYVFNPLTVYWCHDPTARWPAWWPRCTTPTASGTATCCARRPRPTVPARQFYVSPFFPVDGRYRMRLPEPDATGSR